MGSVCFSVSTFACPGRKLVNAITCEIFGLASPNSVCVSLLATSRMTSYMGHLDLISRSPQPAGASRTLWSSFLFHRFWLKYRQFSGYETNLGTAQLLTKFRSSHIQF